MTSPIKLKNVCLTIAAFMYAYSTAVYSEVLIPEATEKSSLPAKEQLISLGTAVTGAGNVAPITNKADAPQRMSCWQYGKLIFEQTVIPPRDKLSNVRLFQNPDSGVKMQFFDFKTAFCLIK